MKQTRNEEVMAKIISYMIKTMHLQYNIVLAITCLKHV